MADGLDYPASVEGEPASARAFREMPGQPPDPAVHARDVVQVVGVIGDLQGALEVHAHQMRHQNIVASVQTTRPIVEAPGGGPQSIALLAEPHDDTRQLILF
jgi:hypothetical protein